MQIKPIYSRADASTDVVSLKKYNNNWYMEIIDYLFNS